MVYRSNLISSSKDLPRLEFEDINSGLGTLNKDISQKLDYRKGLEFNVGDVLFGKLRPYLKNWWYAEFKGIALGDFWNLKSDLWHSCFLYTYIQSNSFQLVANDTSGTKMPRSDWNLVAESIAKFPSLPEQEAIGTFFSTLDQHITLHQRKLDKLKSVKQAYLSEMFPAEGERVPKRRFPGFTDAWEQRKLGEVIEKLKGGVSIAPNDYIEDGYRTIPKGAVNDTGVADMSACKNVSVDFFEKNYFSKTSTGELITSLRDLVPSAPNLGRIVRIVGQFEEFIMPQGVYSLKITDNLLEDFLIAYSNNYIYRSVIQSEKNGSTQVHIRNGEFLNIKIQVPSLPEQEAIGNFFSTLDRQITLHQRKLEKLKNLKKALLNELFVDFQRK